jgi:hypothetical protein
MQVLKPNIKTIQIHLLNTKKRTIAFMISIAILTNPITISTPIMTTIPIMGTLLIITTIPIHVLVMKAKMWHQNGLIKLRILGSSLHNYVHLCSRQM